MHGFEASSQAFSKEKKTHRLLENEEYTLWWKAISAKLMLSLMLEESVSEKKARGWNLDRARFPLLLIETDKRELRMLKSVVWL